MVMSWLINSMTQDIGENFLLYQTGAEIWDAVRTTYSSQENTSELFRIERLLYGLRQGEDIVTTYFNALTRLWQQLDLFASHAWTCTTDEALFRSILDTKRVFQFLLGLNPSFDAVRGRILDTKPLPGLRAVFSEDLQPIHQQSLPPLVRPTSAMAAHGVQIVNGPITPSTLAGASTGNQPIGSLLGLARAPSLPLTVPPPLRFPSSRNKWRC
ncbi:uncharacterized protein [Henckelia pumila]|uniref:uncharacterized protein n=1 Tax=Henckelia pumila TaxID=405737 RepID=UPI003C6E24CA